jgi:CHAT domain-containing protein/Tfp pilus assembly protein PilF
LTFSQTFSRGRVASFTLLLVSLACASYLPAQESRWLDLNGHLLALLNDGKYADALPTATEALKEAEAAFPPDDPRLGIAVFNLATVYDRLGEDAQAEPLLRRALAIDEKAFGAEDARIAPSLNNLAFVCEEQRKYSEAEPLYKRALQIREKALGPDHLDVADSLSNLALHYVDLGHDAEAMPLYLRALAIHEKAQGPDHLDVATVLNNIGLSDVNLGRYAEAEPLYLRALSIDEKALGPDDAGVATNVNNLAYLYYEQGRYAEAEPLYQRGLRIREKALGADHPDVAISLNNLAELYAEQGKFALAEPLYRRALGIDEKALGPEHPRVAVDLDSLAKLYGHQGRYAEAEPLYLRALRIDEKAFGEDHPNCATDLNDLAMLYQTQFRYSEAEPLYQRALRINEKILGPDHRFVATNLNNLAALYVHQQKYAQAEPLYQRALRIDEKTLAPDHPVLATDLNNFARLLDREGKYAQAEPLFKRALDILEKAFGPLGPNLPTGLNNLALLYDNEGDYAAAEPVFQRDFDVIFQQFQYNFSYMSEKERLEFLETVSDTFPSFFSFVHRFRLKDPKLTGTMYDLLLSEKGFIAGSVTDLRRAVEASGDAEALKLLGQLSQKRTQIAALLNVQPPDRALWRKQIDRLQAEANEIEKALVARSSAVREQKKLDRATWQQVRDALQPGEAAVEFARFRYYNKEWTDTDYYAALVVTHETRDQPEYIFLGDASQIQGTPLTGFEDALQAQSPPAVPPAALPGAKAYDIVWKPLEKALAAQTRIYVSPDGALNQIPLGILPAPGGKLLMEQYDLRLLSSTRDILRSEPSPAFTTALLVGDPLFDLSEQRQRSAMQQLALPQQQAPVLVAGLPPDARPRSLGDGTLLDRLPGTGDEVNAIAELLRNHQWTATVYTRDLALKRAVEQVRSPRVVHLATHGYFLPDQHIDASQANAENQQPAEFEDPMLRSGLYFSGANRTLAGKPTLDGLDNGVLTAMEAGSLNLTGTELVVLSACNTGRGEVKNGEGVFGLRRALQEAGAKSVLMSLWSVPDKETMELMQLFYSSWLSGVEIHKALKDAQIELREKVRASHDGNDLPYYWGAFVLVGR